MNRLPNLTSIRFFLASIVILFHLPSYCNNRNFPYYNDLPIFFKGIEAVLAFFSLSGFLIIRSLFIEKEKKEIDLKKFYKRRILRIFPLYYLIFFIGIIFYYLIAPNFGYVSKSNLSLFWTFVLGLTFFPNVLFPFKPGGILEILWSIGIEEQFYILIAPVIKYLKPKFIILFLLVFTFLLIYLFEFSILSPFFKKFKMFFYFFSFSGIIAYYSFKIKNINAVIQYVIYSLTIVIFTTNILKDNFNGSIYNILCMICFSLSIWFLSTKPIRILENKKMINLGEISYGIYMYHTVVFQLIGFVYLKTKVFEKVNYNVSVLIFYTSAYLITLMVSYFSYHYFEKRFLKLKTY